MDMTADEIVATLRLKEKTRNPMSWKMCKRVADDLETIIPKKESRGMRCPHCGGKLSEIRGNVRHCYSCHFEFEVPEEVLNEIYKY